MLSNLGYNDSRFSSNHIPHSFAEDMNGLGFLAQLRLRRQHQLLEHQLASIGINALHFFHRF